MLIAVSRRQQAILWKMSAKASFNLFFKKLEKKIKVSGFNSDKQYRANNIIREKRHVFFHYGQHSHDETPCKNTLKKGAIPENSTI